MAKDGVVAKDTTESSDARASPDQVAIECPGPLYSSPVEHDRIIRKCRFRRRNRPVSVAVSLAEFLCGRPRIFV